MGKRENGGPPAPPRHPHPALRPLLVSGADHELWAPGLSGTSPSTQQLLTRKTNPFPSQLPIQPPSQAQGGLEKSAKPPPQLAPPRRERFIKLENERSCSGITARPRREPGAEARDARPRPGPRDLGPAGARSGPTSVRTRPRPCGSTGVAHLSWERRTRPTSAPPPPLTQELGALPRCQGNRSTADTGTGTSLWKWLLPGVPRNGETPPSAFPRHPGLSQQARLPSGGKSSSARFTSPCPRAWL